MSAAKRITKKQLKDDKFVDVMLLYGDRIKKHQNTVVGGLVLILIMILAFSWGIRYRDAGLAEAQQAFSAALKTLSTAVDSSNEDDFKAAQDAFAAVNTEYGGKLVGKWSIYYMGFCKEKLGELLVAEEIFNEYLDEDPNGEYEIPAILGIASCNGGVGRVKRQADSLCELAASEKVSPSQAQAWLYQAAQVYMASGYFEQATEVLESLKADVDPILLHRIEQDLEALKARSS